ncbi:MAG TPA: hypothetical protein VLQ45_32205 [Thermoanaerobaculia bacterium]|nr:hypothetical protein [Thermoanaerobaculia bacterium]
MATKLTINFPDKLAEQILRLPNPDEFVSHAVEQALIREGLLPEPSTPGKVEVGAARRRA